MTFSSCKASGADNEGQGSSSNSNDSDKSDGKDTSINSVDLTVYIPAPEPGVTPKQNFSAGTDYTGTVVWRETGAGDTLTGAFHANTRYTATVTLTSSSGNSFASGVKVTHTWADPSPASFTGNSGGISGEISFPPYIPFSGTAAKSGDSVIDLIRAAKGGAPLHLQLRPGTDMASLDAATEDFGGEGLVLDSSNSPAELVIDGGGRTIQLNGMATGSPLITVKAGVKLTLRNITLKGLSNNNLKGVRIISVLGNGAELILETGASIKDNIRPNGGSSGAGVYVDGGKFTMRDGTISGNVSPSGGAGVSVYNNGAFIMEGGTISDNRAGDTGDGGGVVVNGSTFVMEGGIISNNRAGDWGGGVKVESKGSFTMKGGTISGNTATNRGGGVYVTDGAFSKSGDSIIYGYVVGDSNSNVVGTRDAAGVITAKPDQGHAVHVFVDATGNNDKKRGSTAGKGDGMSYNAKDAGGSPISDAGWGN